MSDKGVVPEGYVEDTSAGPRWLPGGDLYENNRSLFPDPSTRQYVELHDHERLTVEKILIRNEHWYIIVHQGQLSENEFKHQMLITEDEGLKFADAIKSAEVNPVPKGA